MFIILTLFYYAIFDKILVMLLLEQYRLWESLCWICKIWASLPWSGLISFPEKKSIHCKFVENINLWPVIVAYCFSTSHPTITKNSRSKNLKATVGPLSAHSEDWGVHLARLRNVGWREVSNGWYITRNPLQRTRMILVQVKLMLVLIPRKGWSRDYERTHTTGRSRDGPEGA